MDKHLVFDIDQTLIYSPSEIGWYGRMLERNNGEIPESLRSRVGTIVIPMDGKNTGSARGLSGTLKMTFIIRPKCVEFLKWCFNNFSTVSVWSAGSTEYVKAIVDDLFRRVGRAPYIVWTYDELEDGIKPLSTMFARVNTDKDMNVRNTLLIDDLSYNFDKHPNNGVLIPPYTPTTTLKNLSASDPTLYELSKWLDSDVFRISTDVRCLNKKHIFSKSSHEG